MIWALLVLLRMLWALLDFALRCWWRFGYGGERLILYIAGRMTGLPDLGRRHFMDAEAALTAAGHIVLNPARLPVGMARHMYLPICFAMVDQADAVYMLDDWADSPGARLENLYAQYQGKKIYFETERADRLEVFDDAGLV